MSGDFLPSESAIPTIQALSVRVAGSSHGLPGTTACPHCPCKAHGRRHGASHTQISSACLEHMASLGLSHSRLSVPLPRHWVVLQNRKRGKYTCVCPYLCAVSQPCALLRNHLLQLQVVDMLHPLFLIRRMKGCRECFAICRRSASSAWVKMVTDPLGDPPPRHCVMAPRT